MAGLLQDTRFALRQLRRNLGFTIAATVMLAVAICANSTVFSWINGTMLHPIPGARHTDELVSVMRGAWSTSPTPPLSYLDYRDLRDQNHSLTGLLAYHSDWITLTGAGAAPERIYIGNVSANFFDVLGVKPLLGRFFLPEEETRPDAAAVCRARVLVMEDALCGRPADCGQDDRDCPASCDGDRRSAGGVYRGGAGASGRCMADAESPWDERVSAHASQPRLSNCVGKAAAWNEPRAGDAGPRNDHAADRGGLSERSPGNEHHHAGPDVAIALWRERLHGCHAAHPAGHRRRGAAADLRQCGYAYAGAVRLAAARDCDPPVAGGATRAAGAADGAGGRDSLRRCGSGGSVADVVDGEDIRSILSRKLDPHCAERNRGSKRGDRDRGVGGAGQRAVRRASSVAVVECARV